MHYKIDLSGETPALVGSPLAVLPAEVRGLAQLSLDDLSTALDPCPAHLVGRAFWPIIQDTPPTLSPWQVNSSTATYQINSDNTSVVATYAAESKPLDGYKTELKSAINTTARARILALVPSWTQENHAEKQRNIIGRATQLTYKKALGTTTEEEDSEITTILALWDAVTTIRTLSSTATDNVDAAETSEAAYTAYSTYMAS
jgi:hypothetical protein